jgi:hypothetical protein
MNNYPEVEESTLDIVGVLIKLFLALKQLLLPTTSEHAIVAGELTCLDMRHDSRCLGIRPSQHHGSHKIDTIHVANSASNQVLLCHPRLTPSLEPSGHHVL